MRKLRYVGRYVIEDKTLGKGNFAVVELATHSITKSKVAIKVIDRHQIREEYVRQNLNREARILAQLRHPNIVRLYETISSSSLYCLVTEYAGGGDLLSFVRSQRNGCLRESDARPFVRQLVSALHHLHERGVVHRDLKMENIMLDIRRKNIKIVDFGLSNCFSADQLLSTHCGSPEYAAPELFTAGNDYYGPEVDIWSLGINIYAMVCGKLPFTTPHSENRRQRLLQQLQYGLGPLQEKDLSRISAECRELLHLCIEPHPELRAPLLDIEEQPWITDNQREPFYPYQQPKKDKETKQLIIGKMAVLLNVNKEKIESSVHEFRLNDVSAIYNLLMDDHLSAKGLWNRDHTKLQEVQRPCPATSGDSQDTRNVEAQRQVEERKESTSQQTVPERVSLRTPTIIGMVRPSQLNSESRGHLRSADFELRAINDTEAKPKQRRTKTATFIHTTTKAKPMGNATTHNIILARCNNFGHSCGDPGTSYHSRHHKCSHCEAGLQKQQQQLVHTHQEQKCPSTLEHVEHNETSTDTREHKANTTANQIENIVELQSPSEDINKATPHNQKYSADETHMTTIVKSPNLFSDLHKQPQPHKCQDSTCALMDPNFSDSHKEVKVIDMVKHFNSKHGYQIRETPLVFASEKYPESKSNPRTKTDETTESFKQCDASSEMVTSESSQTAPTVVYKRCIPYSGPGLRKDDDIHSPVTIDIKLSRQDEGYQSESDSERGRSITPRKAKWRPRIFQVSGRQSPSSSPSPSSRHTPRTHYCDFSPPCRSPNRTPTNERPLFCTPVVSLQTTEDMLNSRPMQVVEVESSAEKDTTKITKNLMPQRLSWKKQAALETTVRKKVMEMKTKNSAKAMELMCRNGVHENYPQETSMRLRSAKLRTPPPKSAHSSAVKPNRTALPNQESKYGSKTKQTGMHSSCKTPLTKKSFKMDKYSGQGTPSEQPLTATLDPRNVIDLPKQHMLTLLQEASATLENATKMAERKQCQSQLHYYHHTSHQKLPEKPWQKAINQLQPHHYTSLKNRPPADVFEGHIRSASASRPMTVRTLGKSRRNATASTGGLIAKQLGQQITYTEGTLNPRTERPPTVSPSKTTESVFNLETSRDVQSMEPTSAPDQIVNYRLPKMDSDQSEVETTSQGWNMGYRLERKLSNTLKGCDSIPKMRKTPHSVKFAT